jgi:hypothetical protein
MGWKELEVVESAFLGSMTMYALLRHSKSVDSSSNLTSKSMTQSFIVAQVHGLEKTWPKAIGAGRGELHWERKAPREGSAVGVMARGEGVIVHGRVGYVGWIQCWGVEAVGE